jgi:outer membrane protein
MKNISLILNAVLIVAVAYLYYNEFTETDELKETGEITLSQSGDLPIAYINIDTLLTQYDYYEDVSEKLDNKRNKLQVEYTRRAEALQKQIEDFQRTYTNMTMAQAQAVEQDLSQKQQNLMQYQESIRQDLLREEAEVTQQLYDKVIKFLKSYGEENDLQFVLTYSPGGSVMYANEEYEITDVVLNGLNDEYLNPKTELTDTTSTK